jgi:predicted amino acid racemase
MLAGGAAALADSRADNIRNLRRRIPGAEIEFLRSPVDADEAGFDADVYFVSSYAQVQALVTMAPAQPLKFCLMIETGDGREGAPPDVAAEEASRIAAMEKAELAGLATNAACARNDALVGDALAAFNEAAGMIAKKLGRTRPWPLMSVGGSGLLQLLVAPQPAKKAQTGAGLPLFAPVTELRSGEAILLGRIPSGPGPDLYLDNAHRDAFILEGPVMEVFKKNGVTQALVGFGVQDTGGSRLIPCHHGVSPLSATSDYFAVACDSPELTEPSLRVGSSLSFIPTYYALLAAMTSPFVLKEFAGV